MKFCPRCGFQNAETAIYCARCGSALAGHAAADGPTVVFVNDNVTQRPQGSNPGTVWLWLNIIVTVLACCSNILGIIGIIFGAMAVSKFNNGRYEEARSNANVSKWMFIIGIVLSVVVLAGLVVGMLMGGLSFIPVIIAAISEFASGY